VPLLLYVPQALGLPSFDIKAASAIAVAQSIAIAIRFAVKKGLSPGCSPSMIKSSTTYLPVSK